LAKDNAPEELIPAIRQVASGRKFVTSAFAEKWIPNMEE
jgi:DNA-binding NarL/FixJ family response regulator